MNTKIKEQIFKSISQKEKVLVVQALSLKGRQFPNELLLREYVQNKCSIEYDVDHFIYYAEGKPFLGFQPNVELDLDLSKGAKFQVNIGEFWFIPD